MAPSATATKTKAQTNLDNVLTALREAGDEGTTIKDVATKVGISVDQTRKAVKALEDENKAKRGEAPGTVFAVLKSGRRSTEVVERDEKVYQFIKSGGEDGRSKKAIAEEVGCTEHLAYESLWRLRDQGKVERRGSTRNAVWVAIG